MPDVPYAPPLPSDDNPKHSSSIVRLDSTLYAVCTCGWQSQLFTSVGSADRAGFQHEVQNRER